MKKSSLKRMFTGGMAVAMAVTMLGCGKNADSSASNTAKSKSGTKNSSTSAKSDDAKAEKDGDGPLVIWTQGNSIKEDAEAWGAANGVDVDVVVIPFADLQTKLKQQITDPKTAPDVYAITKDYVKDWVERGVNLDLSEEFPDDAKNYIDNTYKDLVALGSDDKGDLQAVTAEYPVGMMYYNREIAKNILGTADPDEVGKALSDVDQWPDLYEKINDAYSGKIKMFGTTQNLNKMLSNRREKPYVKDDVFTVTKDMANIFEINKQIYDDKMFLTEKEDDAYFSGWNTDAFFVDFLPSWGYSSKFKPQVDGKEGAGKWGMTTPPYAYNRGGTYFFITKTTSHKNNAWDLVKGISVDTQKLVDVQKGKDGFASTKEANKILVDSGYEEPLLGNQKVFEEYQKQAAIQEKLPTDVVTKYDGDIESFMNDAVINYANGSMSLDDAIKGLGTQVQSAYPELTVKYNY